MVSSTPRLHFTPGKDPVPILQEAGWAPEPVWTGGKSCPHQDLILDRPARSQSLYQLSCLAHDVTFMTPRILGGSYLFWGGGESFVHPCILKHLNSVGYICLVELTINFSGYLPLFFNLGNMLDMHIIRRLRN